METAYVINLKTSIDRWNTIKDSFKDTNIQLHRVEPIKPKFFNKPKPFKTKYSQFTSKTNKLHEFYLKAQSLYLTYLSLVKMARKNKLPYILIFEDDCKPSPRFMVNWPKVKTWLHNNLDQWQIYSGGSRYIKDPYYIGNIDNIRFYRPKSTACSHFIYMHSCAYDTIIEKYEEIFKNDWTVEIDTANTKLQLVISYPFLAYQVSHKSILRGKVLNNNSNRDKCEERALGKYNTRKIFRGPSSDMPIECKLTRKRNIRSV